MFNVRYTKSTQKSLKKIDKTSQIIIVGWIAKNLISTSDPRLLGKPLIGDRKGLWRYRVGSYRIVAEIIDNEVTILIIDICHRKDVYKNKS